MPFSALLAGDFAFGVDVLAGVFATTEAPRQRTASQAGSVTIWDGADAVARAASQWRALERVGGATTPFQTFALGQASAIAHLERGECPRVVLVQADGRPLVLLPTAVARRAGLRVTRFLGDPLIQYGDAVVAPAATPEHIEAAIAAAADPQTTDLLCLRQVRTDARIAPVLARRCATVQRTEAPFVAVGAAMRSARRQRELRRLRRRLEEQGDVAFEVVHGADVRPVLADALALKRAWLAQRGIPGRVIGVACWESALARLTACDDGLLAAARLTVGGRLAAAEVALVYQDRWYAFLGAFADEFAKNGPGQIQMNETMAHCAAAGFSAYDLLPPGDAYKTRLACGSVPVHDHALPVTARGRLGLLALRARPVLKTAAERLPPAFRRALLPARP